VLELIEDRKYFTLHAGHQTGKTTSLMWLERHINEAGRCRALWVDVQAARENPDPAQAFRTILGLFDRILPRRHPDLPRPDRAAMDELLRDPRIAILKYLTRLSEAADRPLVILFDEADGLVGEAMVSFLTQLRTGYIDRSIDPFPASAVLVGRRQVRDFIFSAEERDAVAWLGTSSPFNITAEAATLGPFTEDEVAELLGQHTALTGQRFEPSAVRRIYELGCGHPWLTNALADQIVDRDLRDRGVAITASRVDAAKETILLERRSHIDSLVACLREPRVQRILDPMLAGSQTSADVLDDDLTYVMGLGLIRLREGAFEIANPVYREVIPRALTFVRQGQIPVQRAAYVRPDGSLDMARIMASFQDFWSEDGHLAAEGFGYRESGPHLMLMAFLQRIVNGGGRIEREYGLGRGAIDLMISWKEERHAIEIKIRRGTRTEQRALEQMGRYLDSARLSEGWLVLFDLRKELPWSEKLTFRDMEHAGKRIHLVGC
jgi:hypothetical protein